VYVALGGDITADFTSVSAIPVTAASYTATGNSVTISLGFAPSTGTNLTVIRNTGADFISGEFSNLSHGQQISLAYNGANYQFVANYYGGSGNDLVLQWVGANLYSWGSNLYGQLGNNSAGYSSVPVTVYKYGALSGKIIVAMEAGLLHNLALCSDGTMATWGTNTNGQLGNSSVIYSTGVPVSVDATGVLAGRKVAAISVGDRFCLALCSDGTVVSWGDNTYGQLGANVTLKSNVPLSVGGGFLDGKTVVAVSAGYTHSLALCSDGSIAAWGDNGFGQLGNGSTTNSTAPTAVFDGGVLSGKTVIGVAAGDGFSLALCSDGTVASWGYNFNGQLGVNTSTYKNPVPVAVDRAGILANKTVVEVSAGSSHVLARCSDGTVAAWGYNNDGQLGNNSDIINSKIPVAVDVSGVLSGKFVTGVCAGKWHSLVLCSDGSAAGWGNNFNGQLGNNGTTDLSVPAAVVVSGALSGKSIISLSAGSSHSIAVCSDGSALAWGEGGLLVNDSLIGRSSVPVAVESAGFLAGKTVTQISAGYAHDLALCSDGTVAAWGYNTDGQLGDNSTDNRSIPVPVTFAGAIAGKTVVAVAAGGYHSLALCSDGTVFAWGNNYAGQLGDNSTTDSSVPVEVSTNGILAGKTVVAVSAGTYFSLALCSDGTLATWGENDSGQLGNGGTARSSVPIAVNNAGVLAGKRVVSVSAGNKFCLALCSDGTVAAWGSNVSGQLGCFSNSDSHVPVAVYGSGVLAGKTVVEVAAGFLHGLALCSDGTIAAWGDNGSGQLGNNSTSSSSIPVAVNNSGILAGKSVVGISTGSYQCLALCSDGTTAVWGNDGSTKRVPVAINSSDAISSKIVVSMDAGTGHNLLLAAYPLSADSSLGSLTLDTATLSSAFSPKITTYSASVPHTTDSVVITPVASNAYASVQINGVPVQSGGAGQSIPLNVGQNSITVFVTAQNGVEASTYTVTVTRLSNVSTLTSLTLSAASLSPSFDGGTLAYSAGVPNDTTSLTVTPTVADITASATVNGETVISGNQSQSIPLDAGLNVITVLVTAQDGTTSTYKVNVTRELSAVATLSNLETSAGSLTPGFSQVVADYAVNVPNAVSSATVTPILTDSTASVRVNDVLVTSGTQSGAIALAVGSNSVEVSVTAQDGVTVGIYSITFVRAPSSVATLSGLVPGAGSLSPVFTSGTTAYTCSVVNTVTSFKLTPTLTDSTAVVKVNGVLVKSGSASRSIPLVVGVNTITTLVTAQDGTTTKTYTVKITRAKSSDANLSGLVVKNFTLSPAFKPAKTAYTASVPMAATSVKIKASASSDAAKININGVANDSGVLSKAMPMHFGKNLIKIVVTAQDGTKKTYKIMVTRGVSSKSTLADKSALATSDVLVETRVSKVTVDGRRYQQLMVVKPNPAACCIIEVSANLVDWCSGKSHTTVMTDNDRTLTVRDNIPVTPGVKRFIRVKPAPVLELPDSARSREFAILHVSESRRVCENERPPLLKPNARP